MGRATKLRLQIQRDQEDGGETSSSSSTESNHIQMEHNSSSCYLSTDLRLGLTIASNYDHTTSSSRQNYTEWAQQMPSLFVKVNMEGIGIGRKLDLMSHDGYHSLVSTLSHMFKVPILCPDVDYKHVSEADHILTYEDKDGDWMLVGDVPWEMFLSTVKKLRISKADIGS